MTDGPIPAGARIGHVHLKVADLDRAIRFYRDLMGFDLVARLGDEAAFLSAGSYHHHIGLNTWESEGGPPPPAARPASTTSPSTIRRAGTWPSLSNACSRAAGP
jgi:catechol 2,3-dioxygenase